jgi:hypothetical protein
VKLQLSFCCATGHVMQQLQASEQFLQRVCNTGPLMSLLAAPEVGSYTCSLPVSSCFEAMLCSLVLMPTFVEETPAVCLEICALLLRYMLGCVDSMHMHVLRSPFLQVRDDFLRINRDLSTSFNILGCGEKLVVSVVWWCAGCARQGCACIG